jgi:hypothetical protein
MNLNIIMSTLASSVYTKACTDACALNNMGVQMMLQGDFESAASTLKDSLSVRRRMFCRRTQPHELNKFVHKRLQTASTRLSKMSSAASFALPLVLTAVESNDFQSLKAASLQRDDLPMSFSAVLIREPSCLAAGQYGMNFERESGIVLYNFGLACYMLAVFPVITDDVRKQASYDNSAYRSLVLSHSTFSKVLMECEDAADDLESVFLAMLVLSSTGKVFRARNELSKALEAQEQIDTLLMAVDDEYVSALIGNEAVAAPTA